MLESDSSLRLGKHTSTTRCRNYSTYRCALFRALWRPVLYRTIHGSIRVFNGETHTGDWKTVSKFLESENQDIQLSGDTMNFTGTVAAFVAHDDEMDVQLADCLPAGLMAKYVKLWKTALITEGQHTLMIGSRN